MRSSLASLSRLGLALSRALQPIVPLVTRYVIGLAFALAGWGKLSNLDGTTAFFADLGIPLPQANAAFIATLELVGGIALVLGLGTRLFAALLAATMIVAILTAERASFAAALHPFGEKGLTDVVPAAFLIYLGWLVAYGPGALSADHLFFRKAGASAGVATPAKGARA